MTTWQAASARPPPCTGWARAPPGSCANSLPASGPSPTPPSTNCPTASRCGTCARSSSPQGRCHPATSRWPGWKPGSPGPWPNAPALPSAACCTSTPSGTSSAGSAAAWPGSTPLTARFLAAQRNVRAAIALLDWLAARGLTLENAGQGDLDAWLGDARASHRTDAGNFVRWARRNKLTTLDLAATKWGGPSGVIDTETRWEQARWLLHDNSLKPEDRLAGLLVLLYAQRTSVISRLTLSHVQAADRQVLIRLGREPVVLPAPLDALALQVAATRRGHAALGHDGTSAWLFPGGQPGQPISAFQLGERLRQLGIRCGQSRSAALFQLATDLPAAVLARMLGIHISVAVQWQRASAGDWMAYAADVSRRTTRQPVPSRHETPDRT